MTEQSTDIDVFLSEPTEDPYAMALMGEIDKIAESTGSTKESVAQAFIAVRGELETDDQALAKLRDFTKRDPRLRWPLVPNQIVVHGGTGERLSREDTAPDGTIDPKLAAMVAEGKTRYHLDTLTQLEVESRDDYDQEILDNNACPKVRTLGAASSMRTLAAITGLLAGPGRETARATALAEARRKASRLVNSGPTFRVKDTRVGCGGAGCRTLDRCLCICRRCRDACGARKR